MFEIILKTWSFKKKLAIVQIAALCMRRIFGMSFFIDFFIDFINPFSTNFPLHWNISCKSILCSEHLGMIEKDTRLFSFWYFYLDELLFLFIYWWFSNDLKPESVAYSVINCFCKCQDPEKKTPKKHDFGDIIFVFQVFESFENLEIGFTVPLQCSNTRRVVWHTAIVMKFYFSKVRTF